MQDAAKRLQQTLKSAQNGLIEREALVETLALAAVAGEHVLVIGPPGTAKSEAVRRVASALGGSYFEYLLGRFTEPSEIFGPVDLKRLREGVVETETAGMLPEADIAFLDEVFLGSTAILNTLLGVLNERVFRRGHTQKNCPLRLCVGASNALPEDHTLAAFADRFLVRVFVEPIPDPLIEDLLASVSLNPTKLQNYSTLKDLDTLASAATSADLSGIRPVLAEALRRLRKAGITLTDRRAVRTQKLIAAAAVIAGRTTPTEADLWPLILAVPTKDEQTLARETLKELLAATENSALARAAEDASNGPLARAARLCEEAERLLAIAASDSTESHRLRIEGILREIDAGFSPGSLPTELNNARKRLVESLLKN
jgi:MoxR-like ATPase